MRDLEGGSNGSSLHHLYVFVEEDAVGRDIDYLEIHGVPGPQVIPVSSKDRCYGINPRGIICR